MLFAIEVEGKQHYQQVFWQTGEQYTYLHDCDILKARTLRHMGVTLVKLKEKEHEWTKEEFIEQLRKYEIQVPEKRA